MKDWNQPQILYIQLMKMMNKPKKHSSKLIQKLQQNRSEADFEKTKKRMMLAAKIADGIKAKGWNNVDLARELDQHNSVISKWLSGTHNFTADTLFDIEKVLGVNLLNYEEPHNKEIIHKYELTVSVKASDVMASDFTQPSLLNDENLRRYISVCGGLARF